MITKKEAFNQLYWLFMRINNKFNILQRNPIDYGSGENLHISEIHTLEAIEENSNAHMADIAKILGVTRGAIMQMTGKLVKKGLLEKYMAEYNSKLVYFRLTTKGKTAYRGHQIYHMEMKKRIFSYFKNVPLNQIEVSVGLMNKIEDYINKYIIDRNKNYTRKS